MKNILLLTLIISGSAFGQQGLRISNLELQPSVFGSAVFYGSGSYANSKISYRYDTSVLYKGDSLCDHRFVEKKSVPKLQVCAVAHGFEGCSDDWYNNNSICTKCLKHIHVKETRFIIKQPDEYEEALEKLNKLKPIQ